MEIVGKEKLAAPYISRVVGICMVVYLVHGYRGDSIHYTEIRTCRELWYLLRPGGKDNGSF